jgi:UDP-2,3-diacylglucosamine hydrolase
VAHYFLSDIHLRPDRPDRDQRLRTWLAQRSASDSLIIVGDLCDFWMGSRAGHGEAKLLDSQSLRMLSDFRAKGGDLAIMAGNHDLWLCPFYERSLGARIIAEPFDMTASGVRLRLVHGHLLGARRAWKSLMETQFFFEAFGRLPDPVARKLDQSLARKNEVGLLDDEERHLAVYREYAASCAGLADIVVIGHVHRPVDEQIGTTRLVVLGGWQRGLSYLKIDAANATFVVSAREPVNAEERSSQN